MNKSKYNEPIKKDCNEKPALKGTPKIKKIYLFIFLQKNRIKYKNKFNEWCERKNEDDAFIELLLLQKWKIILS
ncbi:hypothetical protein [Chishuiella sp.]|uniref:hypothetical protein n=1 Tax=Chishuiella sp. TaxID=1969467 RepID=UPI0028ADBB7A|nr:hypothetical protein [Chishuiella sp.]